MAMQLVLPLHALAVLSVVATSSALAQQPARPLPRVGGCPLGYYASGNYCLSSPSNQREAMEKQGNGCPIGWFSSGRYCLQNR